MRNDLQYGFAEKYGATAFDRARREKKAAKVLAILADAIGPLGQLHLLDVGCSTGFMTNAYARHFGQVTGVDIDIPAVQYAAGREKRANLSWGVMDSQRFAIADQTFDVVTCTHIYEHVPDAALLMAEIDRVLKPGGVCFFSAGNRFSVMEPHYRLPLLSVMPRWAAHCYLRMMGQGSYYYEQHLTYWGLRRLVGKFSIDDYTLRVLEQPARFHADDLVVEGSYNQTLALAVLRLAFWLCPTYLWVLRKAAA